MHAAEGITQFRGGQVHTRHPRLLDDSWPGNELNLLERAKGINS